MPDRPRRPPDADPAHAIEFVGTIKWRRSGRVTVRDVAKLKADAAHVPGAGPGTALVGVGPAGVAPGASLSASWTAEDLLTAWPQ